MLRVQRYGNTVSDNMPWVKFPDEYKKALNNYVWVLHRYDRKWVSPEFMALMISRYCDLRDIEHWEAYTILMGIKKWESEREMEQ